jgi:beta-galactosidase
MNFVPFNEGWTIRGGVYKETTPVDLPFDALMHQGRSQKSLGGVNTGYWENADFFFEKRFTPDHGLLGKRIFLCFDQIYHRATISFNNKEIAQEIYGFNRIRVEVTSLIRYGEENVISVCCHCADEPNCRWYPGAGILRPVYLGIGGKAEALFPEQVKISTLSLNPPLIALSLAKEKGHFELTVFDPSGKTDTTLQGEWNGKESLQIPLKSTFSWSIEAPSLYRYRLAFGDDVIEGAFGLRTILFSRSGFLLNGQRVLLKGACIHSGGGLLGGVSYADDERRRVRLLKQGGYNAIRCAHNPCSENLLNAADEEGVLVMDELYDGWYIHKTQHDYADEMENNWPLDLKNMIDKDYNHPSVIIYSLGNEVAETGEKRGVELAKKMQDEAHRIDPTRAVSIGVNIFFNFLYSMGFGVYSDKKAQTSSEKKVGSAFFNDVAGRLGGGFMKWGATLPGSTRKTKSIFSLLDVAGYNYGINRYHRDLKRYPNRLILGTETFVFDAPKALELMEKNPRILGDFVWSGVDYFGEVGVGSWLAKDYAKDLVNNCGWVSAGAGRIDLTGKPTAESAFTRVAFGLDPIRMAVVPPSLYRQKHSPSAWKMTNALESWAFPGEAGQRCEVDVFSRAPYVGLYLNEEKIGIKKTQNDRAVFHLSYQEGILRSLALNPKKEKVAEVSFSSLQGQVSLRAIPERLSLQGDELVYVRFVYADEKGEIAPTYRGEVNLTSLTGATLLSFGSACPFQEGAFDDNKSDTFYGECLLVAKPTGSKTISLKASSPYGDSEIRLSYVSKRDQ